MTRYAGLDVFQKETHVRVLAPSSRIDDMRYLTVDGMLSGTGIRESVEGGYLEPSELGVSRELSERIVLWLRAYEEAHFGQFGDKKQNAKLDEEGLLICRLLEHELPDAKIEYFSSADMSLVRR